MNKDYKKHILYAIYFLIVCGLFAILASLGNLKTFQDFITKIEKNSFDIRQSFTSKYKKANQDIIIVAIDDASYEYIMNKYGSWPISRKIWSDTINFMEQAKPKKIIFDLLFLKPNLYDLNSDLMFVNTIKMYDNIYLSMNFDNYDDKVRKSPELDEKLQLKLKDGGLFDNEYVKFVNARTIMPELSKVTDKIGSINVTRDSDGIIRNTTPIFKYKDKYYPNLSLKVAMDLLNAKDVSIQNNKIILDKNHKIPLDNSQRAILNWYGKSGTYKHIPLWEIIEGNTENDPNILYYLKDKIIYIGTSATSLSDIKSVPVESHLAGVELHATFLNNIFDNNFIERTSPKVDFIISILISIIVGYFVLKISSVAKTIVLLLSFLSLYWVLSGILMLYYNLWIPIVLPFCSTITIFILTYCEKYLLKVKDYEQTYKLAVTDGLTNLYNHRFFQEQMISNVNNYNRYQTAFSLILIDIDFFKKFNDTYGHQSGDNVLKQVANILKKNSRTSDIVCRYGGEEMAIILVNTKKDDAIITANKICNAVRNTKFILEHNEKVKVTISVGIASIENDGKTPQEIIEYCDKCLYKAKEKGRNQVVSEI